MFSLRQLSPIQRGFVRSFCNKPPSKTTGAKVDEKKKTTAKEDKDKQEEDVGPHVNPETGEYGGPKGPEPTRYGDWERKGRVSDF